MNNELYHYGVKGMKWGQHLFGKDDTTLSKREFKTGLRKDRKDAFEYGKTATVAGKAQQIAQKKTEKAQSKLYKALAKDPDALKKSTQRKEKNLKISKETEAIVAEHYKAASKRAEQHCNMLMEKYGKENVKPIKYNEVNGRDGKQKYMNERTTSGKEWAQSMGITFGSLGLAMAGVSPVYFVSMPYTSAEKGNQYQSIVRNSVKRKYK